MEGMLPNGTRHALPIIGDGVADWPANTAIDQDSLSVRDLLGTLWKKLWIITLVTVLVTGAATGYGLTQTPMYQASIKVLVGQGQGLTPDSNSVIGLQQLTQSMAELAYTRTVADAVIQDEDLRASPDQFLSNMGVEQVGETQVIEVSYKDPDPERASQIANTIGDEFSGQVSKVSSDANSITAVTWERASVPLSPISPNLLRNGLLALVLGLMLGVGLAFLLEYLDDSWRSPEEAMQVSGVPTFAAVREFKLPKKPRKREE